MKEEDAEKIQSMLNSVSVPSQVTSEDMAEERSYTWISLSQSLAISKIKSKAVQKYLLQLDRLTFKQGDLHCLYINNDVEYCQMILPIKYQAQVLQMLHNGQGH